MYTEWAGIRERQRKIAILENLGNFVFLYFLSEKSVNLIRVSLECPKSEIFTKKRKISNESGWIVRKNVSGKVTEISEMNTDGLYLEMCLYKSGKSLGKISSNYWSP